MLTVLAFYRTWHGYIWTMTDILNLENSIFPMLYRALTGLKSGGKMTVSRDGAIGYFSEFLV